MCGGGSLTVTVAAFLVACVSNLYNVLYVGSPTILSKVGKVNAVLMASAVGAVVMVSSIFR